MSEYDGERHKITCDKCKKTLGYCKSEYEAIPYFILCPKCEKKVKK
jgi:NAD-dependent SIR2 family protein deacetylase